MCSQARPTCTAHPNPPGDDETKTVVPSRRHPQSIDAAARHRFSPASPGPTGDAYDRPGTFWARPLCPGAPYPWSILLADTAGCRPGCAPCGRHSPSRWLLGSYRLCPDGHTMSCLFCFLLAATMQTCRTATSQVYLRHLDKISSHLPSTRYPAL